jgi:hypothetical protein
MLNSEERVNSLTERFDILKIGKVPAGLKPDKAPFECESAELKSSCAGTTLAIEIPDDATFAEAREIVYVRYLEFTANIDMQIEKMRCASLVRETSLESFLKLAGVKMQSSASGLKKFTSLIGAPPGLLDPNQDAGYQAAVKCFQGVAKERSHERAKRAAKFQRAKEKKEKLEKAIAEKTPEEVIEGKIVEVLKGMK